jgi:hypothetical protein
MITKEQFEAFEIVRESGLTNMFAVRRVAELSEELTETELTKEDVVEIEKNYKDLKEKYA